MPDPRALLLKTIIATSTPFPPIRLRFLHKMAATIWVATNGYKRGPSAAHPGQHGGKQPSGTGVSVKGIHWNGKPLFRSKLVPQPKVSLNSYRVSECW